MNELGGIWISRLGVTGSDKATVASVGGGTDPGRETLRGTLEETLGGNLGRKEP